MECRTLEVTLYAANDIKDVNFLSKMDVYAVVSISGAKPKQKFRSPVHKDGGTNPRWNNPLFKFTVDVAAVEQGRLRLKIKLVSDRTVGPTVIGKAVVPVKELLGNYGKEEKSEKPMTYAVVTPKGRSKGTVSFGYKFGEKFSAPLPVFPEAHKNKAHGPVMAYPATAHAGPSSAAHPPYPYPPQPQPGYAYAPPPHAGYGYAPPPQAGYGYAPPPQAGYGGYPPVVQPGYGYAQKPQKPKRGGGNMALGLGAGLLGGLLIGDMVGDVGEMAAYDAGYDDGFDGGDFDF